MEQAQQRKYTVDKYMALEAQGGVRHKFFEGEVFAMSGGMAKHNTLVLNCAFAMRTGLRGGNVSGLHQKRTTNCRIKTIL